MREKLEYYLSRIGFKKLVTKLSGFTVYFTMENRYANALLLVDLDENPDITKEQYTHMAKQTSWKFVDGGCIDVHLLSLIFCSDRQKARSLCENDSFAWLVDTTTGALCVEQDKVEDFYGMKAEITKYLQQPYEPNERLEEPLEYNAKGQRSYQSIKDRPLVNHGLFVINVLVFTACILTGDFLYERGILSFLYVIEEEQWYRILTSMFLHADMSHLVGNMMLLYFLGDIVERALGHVKYVILYMLSGVAASFASMAFSYVTQDFAGSLGASGAIFGMVGALLWVVLRNHGHLETITVPKVIFLISYTLYQGFAGTNIDNAAHIGGLVSGFILAMLLYHKKKKRKKPIQQQREGME